MRRAAAAESRGLAVRVDGRVAPGKRVRVFSQRAGGEGSPPPGGSDPQRSRRESASVGEVSEEGAGEGIEKVWRAQRSGNLWPRSGHPGNRKSPSRGTDSPLGRRASADPSFKCPSTGQPKNFSTPRPHGFGDRRTGQRRYRGSGHAVSRGRAGSRRTGSSPSSGRPVCSRYICPWGSPRIPRRPRAQ